MKIPFDSLYAGALTFLLLFAAGFAGAQSASFPGAIPPSPVRDPAKVTLTGDWQIKVTYHGKSNTFDIDPLEN